MIESSADDVKQVQYFLQAGRISINDLRVSGINELQQIIANTQWDIILSDYSHPDFIATEALSVLASHDQEIPFIVLSNHGGEDAACSLMDLGAHDYVMKGNMARLVPAIRRSLREVENFQRVGYTQAALQKSEARFRAITSNLPGVVFQCFLSVDKEITFPYVSDGSVVVTDEILQRCIELKQMGYQLALDDVVQINKEIKLLLPIVNVVKIDILALEKEALVSIVNQLKRWPVLLLAEKVNTSEQAQHCMELGFDMFQGYYFAKPETLTGKRADPAKISLLNILTLVMSDCDVADIERELKHQPSLSYNLLRMANSSALGFSKNINSIKQAIMVLGRKQLQRWIQLLLYVADNKNEKMSDAMLKMAATRGKMMELIAAADRPHDKNHQDRAFMVGILSLLDALLGIEMTEIIDKLSIPADTSQALLSRSGRLGQELKLIEENERGEIASVKSILAELNFLSLSELTVLELEALGWANRIGEAA